MTFFRRDIDVSIMALNNAVNRGQSKTGAPAHAFGREKRIKYALERLIIFAGTAVGDGLLNIFAGPGVIMVAFDFQMGLIFCF